MANLETLVGYNHSVETITATCSGGTMLQNAVQEVAKIMREFEIANGFVIHNDRRFKVILQMPYDYEEVKL